MVRARGDLLDDRKRMQQRLSALLLRHGRAWSGGSKWTLAHRLWVDQQRFDEPALQEALDAYRGALDDREAELRAAKARLSAWARHDPLAPAVARLGAYRGIAEVTALTLAAEVVDWYRFPFARAFMGFTGLIPSEYSSGSQTRRGSITKAGPEAKLAQRKAEATTHCRFPRTWSAPHPGRRPGHPPLGRVRAGNGCPAPHRRRAREVRSTVPAAGRLVPRRRPRPGPAGGCAGPPHRRTVLQRPGHRDPVR
jgi:transposase